MLLIQQAQAQAQALSVSTQQAQQLLKRGIQQTQHEKYQQAIQTFQQALDLAQQLHEQKLEATATALVWLGFNFSQIGKPKLALKYYNQCLLLVEAARYRSGEAITLFSIGTVYDNLGQKQEALRYYNQSLPLSQAQGDRSGEATTLNNIGKVYDDLGQKQEALKYYHQSLPLFRAMGDRSSEAIILNNIGKVHDDLGQKQEALKYYHQSLPLSQAVKTHFGEATTLNNIGKVYDDLGQKQEALKHYYQSLLLFHIERYHSGEARVLNNIGRIYDDLGQKQEALKYYHQSLLLVQALGDRQSEAVILNSTGKVYDDLGQKQEALKYYHQSLFLRRAVEDRSGEAIVLGNLGILYRDTNRPTDAINYLEKSSKITLTLRQDLQRQFRRSFLQVNDAYATAFIELLLNQKQYDKAFEWVNLFTTADLADYSRLVNAKVANPEAQRAIDQWNQKNFQLESLRKKLQQKFSLELSQQVNQLQGQLNQQAENIRNQFPEVADLFETKPTDISQLQSSIPVGTTVVQPVLLTNVENITNTIALFILTKDKLKVTKVPIDSTKFNLLLKQTYTSLTNRFDDKYIDNLEKLYNLLIRPIEAEIQATNPKQLGFIATGKLRYIPFEALYDAKTDQYLIQKYPVSYLTRLSTRSLQAKGTQSATSVKKVLAFGNPVTKPPLALPGAEAEVKSITQIFPGSEALINTQATLNAFKIQSPRFSLLHLATHGCFQKGGCPKLGLEENTLLFADQRFNIRDAALLGLQNVDLIALSACQTALQTNSNGEEIAGLAYIFERAGSKSVIASLWNADDSTTEAIMVQFYQNLKKGMSKSEALRQAKLSQIDSHPFFWSPFVLIGDAG